MATTRLAFILLATIAPITVADELAWGDVSADGSLETRSLDVPVATARGAENFFISNPMDSHDWSHTSVVRNTLMTELKAKDSRKVADLVEALKPIYSAMPKDAEGRLNNGTARYALHRFFNQKHGWSIKGLEPAGAGWMSTMSVTPDVKDVIKYMVPSYLQQLLSDQLGVVGFDLQSLAVLAAVIEHLIHAEMISIVYAIFTTLELPIPGKRTEREVDDVIDTFMMVFAFGLNLDSSILADVQKARTHLANSHSGWPQLQGFAKEVKQRASAGGKLDFTEIVQLAEKITEGYGQWQGKDCTRAKDELTAKPSHREGRVQLSDLQASHATGRRSLFTESADDLEKLGVLSKGTEAEAQLIIPNYVNSQSMCLSTASLYTVCCVNECDSLLAKLEREVAGPAAEPDRLMRLLAAQSGHSLAEPLLQELHGLVDQSSGLVSLHGRALAGWMHRAFPLQCPAPSNHKITNPKTPDEWMGESGLEVADLEEMIAEIAQVLNRYTTMGKKAGADAAAAEDPVSDPDVDVVRIRVPPPVRIERDLVAAAFQITAMFSMIVLVVVGTRSAFQDVMGSGMDKKHKLKCDFV